jgi:hypothetical protein
MSKNESDMGRERGGRQGRENKRDIRFDTVVCEVHVHSKLCFNTHRPTQYTAVQTHCE